MKKVLIIIDNITNRAGTERAVTNLCNMLVSSGLYDVTLVSVKKCDEIPAYNLHRSVKTIYWQINFAKSSFQHVLAYLKTYNKIEKSIKNSNYDFIIGTESFFNYLLCFLGKKIKKIGCEHFGWQLSSFHHKILRKILYKKLDAVVVLTNRDLEKYNFINNAYRIPNSLSFLPEKTADYNNKVLVAIGRLTKQKGFDLLLKAACLIKQKLPDWKIKIYGTGELFKDLENEITAMNLNDYVSILPPQSNVEQIYYDSSIYVMTSRFEGLPMVLIEAQSCGLPVVSFDCPEGPKDVINNNENGFLIENGDIETFAKKVIEIASDNDLWNKMSYNSINLSKRFNNDAIFLLWDKLFNSI